MNAFLDAYRVLARVFRDGAHFKIALAELPAGEHGFTVRLAYAVLEQNGYLDLCVRTLAKKRPQPSVALILKIGLCAMLFADMPRPVAVNEAVGLAKILKKPSGFVNACLREFDEARVSVPAGIEGLCVRSNFPRFAVERIAARYGSRAEAILLARPHGVTVRFREGASDYDGLPHEDTPFENVKIFGRFSRDENFFAGKYTFQSVGSVAVCSVVESCESLLDACAAPGGKSVLLAERCKKVVACDLHSHRVSLIGSYCARMDARNVEPVCADSTVFRPEWEGAFDGVLCDVPCSGLGTVAENPDLPLRKEISDMVGLNAVQTAILNNCSRYVKKGGALYYSTCSILAEENDGVVGGFLAENRAFRWERVDCPLLHEETEYGMQFLPDRAYGAGFYVAKLRSV